MKKLTILTGIVILSAVGIATSCKKKPVKQEEPTKEISKFELIPGNYKVYDTLGNYLYYMELKHKKGMTENGVPTDSLEFINMDGQYNYTIYQTNLQPPSWPKNFFDVGFFDPILDANQKRSFFFGRSSFYNNDTIYLDFKRDNIKYYIPDMVPYSRCDCKQIGVKQH